jgi:integrase
MQALNIALERLRRRNGWLGPITLSELVAEYLAQHEAAPRTIAKLRWLLAKATGAFGDRRVVDLQSEEIGAWRATLAEGHRFEATQALRQVLNRAVAWKIIESNPAKVGVDNPRRQHPEKCPFESWGELDALGAQLGPVYGPMVVAAAATGLRPGEWIALEQRDLDRESRVVYVRRAFAHGRLKRPKTRRSVRAVPLQAIALEALDRLPARADTPLLFSAATRRLSRPAQLPPPRLEAGPARRWDRAAAAAVRPAPHLRDLRFASGHLHLRPLPLHGLEPDDDRPPLRPPRARWARARGRPPRLACGRGHRHRRGGRLVDIATSGRRRDGQQN